MIKAYDVLYIKYTTEMVLWSSSLLMVKDHCLTKKASKRIIFKAILSQEQLGVKLVTLNLCSRRLKKFSCCQQFIKGQRTAHHAQTGQLGGK